MIAIGIGANSRAHKDDFVTALSGGLKEAGSADAVATFHAANFASSVEDAARLLSVRYCPVTLAAMRERSGDCVTRSERTLSLFGVASIAEAAALAAAGSGSHLIMPRRIVGNITIAAAQSRDERGTDQ